MADEPLHDNEGRSLSGRVGAGENEQEELFPVGMLEGDKRSLANLIGRGLEVKTSAVVKRAAVPAKNGLFDPDSHIRIAVTCEAEGYRPKPKREVQGDGTKRVVSWEIVQELSPVFVEVLGNEEEAVRREFERLLGVSAQRALELLDALQARASEYQQTGERRVA